MRHTPKTPARPREPAETDTSSFEQVQGTPAGARPPTRRNPRLPHERDESATATGNRQDEEPVPSDRQISDAADDVESGRVDTDRRGVPNDLPKRR